MHTLNLTAFETIAIWSVLAVAILGLLYAVFLRNKSSAKTKARQPCKKSGWRSRKAPTPTSANS